jgi:hypothetical protein
MVVNMSLLGAAPTRLTVPIGCLLIAFAPSHAEAQVRRGEAGAHRAAHATRPHAVPAQRPAAGNAAVSGNVRSGTRVGAGSNVAIGNDINVVRPPAGGYPAARPPGYRPPAAAYPPAYRPPVVVPVYPGYPSYSGPSTGELLAAGVVAGATAGLISGAMQQPGTATSTSTGAAAPTGTTLTVGMQLSALPSGCTAQTAGGITYHRCGGAWVQPYMQGSQVVYVVVPAPPG